MGFGERGEESRVHCRVEAKPWQEEQTLLLSGGEVQGERGAGLDPFRPYRTLEFVFGGPLERSQRSDRQGGRLERRPQ